MIHDVFRQAVRGDNAVSISLVFRMPQTVQVLWVGRACVSANRHQDKEEGLTIISVIVPPVERDHDKDTF